MEDEKQRIEVLENEMKQLKGSVSQLSTEFQLHEMQCTERWHNNQEMLQRIEKSVCASNTVSNARFSRIERILFSIAGAIIIGALIAVTGGMLG